MNPFTDTIGKKNIFLAAIGMCVFFGALSSVSAATVWPVDPTGEDAGGSLGNLLYPDIQGKKFGIGTTKPTGVLDIFGTNGRVTLTGDSITGGSPCFPAEEKVPIDSTSISSGYTIGGEQITSVGTGYVCTSSNTIDWKTGDIQWWNNPNTEVTMSTDGSIGIGISSPSEKIDIGTGNLLVTAGNPVHIGTITDDGTNTALLDPVDIAISGNYAFVVSSQMDGIEILDISNPTQPTHVSRILDDETTAFAGPRSISVNGDYAYVTSLIDDGLQIIDISNISSPVPVGKITDDGTNTALDGAYGLSVSGKYAYVTSYLDDGLQIIDISDPMNPLAMGKIIDNGGSTALYGAQAIAITGDYAYVGSSTTDGIQVVNISDPMNPTPEAKIDEGSSVALAGVSDIVISGNYAYIAGKNDNGIEVLDITDPAIPTHVTALYDDATMALGGVVSLAISGNYLFAAGYTDNGFEAMEISGISALSISSDTLTGGSLRALNRVSAGGNISSLQGLIVGSGGIMTDESISSTGTRNNYFKGNIGIATHSPEVGLHIAGGDNLQLTDSSETQIEFRNTTAGIGDFTFGMTTDGNLSFESNDSGTFSRIVSITPSGLFGIGISDPQEALHISNTSSPASLRLMGSNMDIELEDTDSNTPDFRIAADNNRLDISSDPTEISVFTPAMTILDHGDTGIGTTNPLADLHVVGTDGITSLRIENTAGTDTAIWELRAHESTPTNGFSIWGGKAASEATRLIVDSNGNITFGDSIGHGHALQIDGGDVNIHGSYFANKGCLTGPCSSDRNLKTNIEPIKGSLQKISNLRPVTFRFLDEQKGKGVQIGLIAQEVEKIFPRWVTEGDDGYKGIYYGPNVNMHLIKALQELQTGLDTNLSALEQENAALEAALVELEKKK